MEIIFTRHAEEKLKERKISKENIIEAINHPTKVLKKHQKYYFQKKLENGSIEVPCEKTEKHIKVITVYWL